MHTAVSPGVLTAATRDCNNCFPGWSLQTAETNELLCRLFNVLTTTRILWITQSLWENDIITSLGASVCVFIRSQWLKTSCCVFSLELRLRQEELTIGCVLLAYGCRCVYLVPSALLPPALPLSALLLSPSVSCLCLSPLLLLLPLPCHGVGAGEWRIIIRYSTEHSVDSPSEPRFHISSRKMPALTVAGSRLKNQVRRATGRPICSKKKPFKWEERS